jgi:hypothetical protein
VLLAVAQNWRAVEFADPASAYSSPEVMVVVLATQGRLLAKCSSKVQQHKPCALAAVRHDWRALTNCSKKLQVLLPRISG